MSTDLIKKVGLGLVALLVVWNTYTVQSMKQHTKRSRAALSGLRARMVEAPQHRVPAQGQRGSRGSGEGRGRWEGSKDKKQHKSESE